jgi:MFS family permease
MHAFRALRRRDYGLYFSGQLVSWVGTWMQSVAMAWMVHRITGQPVWLGVVAFASQAPSFALAPVGGVLADRSRPRRLALLTQALLLVQALAMTWLAWSGHTAIWPVVVLAVMLGTVSAFDLPARNVLVAMTVPREDLPNAIALNSALFHGSRIVGPAVAGVLLASAGEAWCFALNAASYLAALVTLLAMRSGSDRVERGSQSLRERLVEGARFVRDRPQLRDVFLFMGLVVFLGMPYTAIMPVFADTILKAGPRGMGWLMGAGGVGATVAALLLASWTRTESLPRLMVLSTIGMAVALSAFAFSTNLRLSMVFIALASLGLVMANTGNNTLVNMLIPHELRGRVTSLYAMVFMGAIACGALATGLLTQRFGAPWTLTFGAAGCVVAALLFGRAYRRHGEAAIPLRG